MIPRVCGVSGLVLCALTAASLCFAADPIYAPGMGGVGVQIGGSTFKVDRAFGGEWFGDYSAGAIPRASFAGTFRYMFSRSLRFQGSPGLTWAGYKGDLPVPFVNDRFPDETSKRTYLTVMVPISAQLQYTMQRGWWLYHIGAGPGIYRVWIQQKREVVKDPLTKRIHRGLYLGGSGELGVEYFIRHLPSTSVELTAFGDLAITERDEQFPSGFNSNVGVMGVRLGVSYYFTPGVRKKDTPPPAAQP